jgi:hypothetical protein
LRHVSGGSAYIQGITLVQSKRSIATRIPAPLPADSESLPLPWHTQASYFAREAIRLVDALQPYASYEEYGEYLLPIKKAGGRAYSAAEVRGPLSGRVRNLLIGLKEQIEFAKDYLDETFERSAVFDLVVEIKALAERLDQLLP